MSPAKNPEFHFWDIIDEDGRQVIYEWSQKRRRKQTSKRKSAYQRFLIYAFTWETINSFLQNINFMVLVQMSVAFLAVYISTKFNLTFDVSVSLFVSPIVFPLAFSINTDFQRREKVLEDLANFKAAAMLWFFCMRDWREAANLDKYWMRAVHQKLKSMLFYMREYLMTEKIDRRKIILRAMYEDFSDINQLIENIRSSVLPTNTALVSLLVGLLNKLCLAFERLRVVREYRSPRSIRSFNKVLIFFLPTILSPYFVFMGKKTNNLWSPYYIAVLVAFVFSALQGVQDKLDDPFDGMSEDDINLSSIDEWTFQSLEATVNRTHTIGRFKVAATAHLPADPTKTIRLKSTESFSDKQVFEGSSCNRYYSFNRPFKIPVIKRASSAKFDRGIKRESIKRLSAIRKLLKPQPEKVLAQTFNPKSHPYTGVLDKIKGSTTISRGGKIKTKKENSLEGHYTPRQCDSNLPPGLNLLFKTPDACKNITEETPVKKVSFSSSTSLKIISQDAMISCSTISADSTQKENKYPLNGETTTQLYSPISELDEIKERQK